MLIKKEEDHMAKNLSNRKPNVKNLRSHALNSTKKKQKLNLKYHNYLLNLTLEVNSYLKNL